MERKLETKRGITLISLVITIVILLILATVAINLAVDSDGLFSKAGDAANKWNSSVATEQTTLQNLLGMTEKLSLPEGWNKEAVSKVIEQGNRKAPIPDGFVASKVSTEDQISEGLVIYQTNTEVNDINHDTALTSYNQYVWIPVDDINDMVMCKEHGASVTLDTTTLQCPTCGTATELAGKLYATITGDTFNAELDTQTYTNDDDENFSSATVKLREPDDLTSTSYGDATSTGISAIKSILNNTTATSYAEIKDAWNELLQTDFENMAKSVAKYGGFYISRYEIGVGGTSFKGQTVLNNSGSTNWWTLFSTLRSNPEIEAPVYSQMIWGSQYDQVIKFLDEDPENEPTVGHNNRELSNEPQASGLIPLDEMSNIFDLAGNYTEWTAEANSANNRVPRGGDYHYVGRGFFDPASYRDYYNPTYTGGYCSSRLALYVTI